MADVRLGFIGAGAMGIIHLDTFRGAAGAKLAAVADVSEERAVRAAAEYGVEKTYTDSVRLIADPDIDAVVISVPNALHAELAVASLEAGKHVLLEKPMAMNAAEAEHILAAQQSSGMTLMIGHQMRWKAPIAAARRYIEEGRLGKVYYVKAGWLRRMGIPMGNRLYLKGHDGGRLCGRHRRAYA